MNEYEPEEVERLTLEGLEKTGRARLTAGLKWPLLTVLVVVLVGVPVWLFILKPDREMVAEVEIEVVKPSPEPPQFGEVYLIEDLIVNPATGRRHFMVSIALEYFDEDKLDEIKRREPLLRDNLVTLFSSQPIDVLTNIRYRRALRSRVKKIMDYQLGEGVVTRIFFHKWVSQ